MTQRPIKFRAWDRKQKRFDTCRNGGDHLEFSLDKNGISELSERGYKVYQQFTGLHDKNGKEIWEGDLIGEPGFVMEIVFEDGAFRIGIDPAIDFISARSRRGNATELIGNVFENPDLLTQTNT